MSGSVMMARKIINVTGKRQITIPQKFYNLLGMGKEIECELTDNALILRPFRKDMGFATEILKDLVSQGLSGDELIKAFEEQQKKISMAISDVAEQADEIASGRMSGATIDEVFGEE
ncbi:MAG: AbrB/MazE/SpoVT family DNA-binding domain-containing protein [Clostridia bacterium]|nr:AbrB/MazE/SpoVT family DNA-binding domain-containing protein [Clostridia bacterium]